MINNTIVAALKQGVFPKTSVTALCLDELIAISTSSHKPRIETLKAYVKNNTTRLVDYRERQKNGLVFTSNLAESTVESLISQRCKGQQHMRWSREGLDPLLQLQAAIGSNDWDKIWKTAVMNAIYAQQ